VTADTSSGRVSRWIALATPTAPVLAARTLIATEPNYSKVSAHLLNDRLRREALSFVFGRSEQATQAEMADRFADYFPAYVKSGVQAEVLNPELARFDLAARRNGPCVPRDRPGGNLRSLPVRGNADARWSEAVEAPSSNRTQASSAAHPGCEGSRRHRTWGVAGQRR
jgi:hypothetical protein